MTTPASNDADKPATTNAGGANTGASTNAPKAKSTSGNTKGDQDVSVSVRLLAQSWLCPVEDDKGKITYVDYKRGDELEVPEDVFESLSGPDAFKPAFEKLEADS